MEGLNLPVSKVGVIQDENMLDWKEIKKYAEYVRQEGISQFINLYRKVKDRTAEAFVWGDEIEHMLIKLDDVEKTAQVLPKNILVLRHLNCINSSDNHGSTWMPEYGAHQVESKPGRPFWNSFSEFSMVEANMKLRSSYADLQIGIVKSDLLYDAAILFALYIVTSSRRKQVKNALDRKSGEVSMTMTHLPRFGCPDSCFLPNGVDARRSEITRSLHYPDAVISPFGRFHSLEINTRGRRGEHVSINVPDKNTASPFWDPHTLHQRDETAKVSKVGHIHSDCTVAGSSYSCIQVTFQTSNLLQAKYLYDQLIPMCPIMLALSASTPAFRGFLSDVDCRWNAMSESVDSRKREERGLESLEESKVVISKARCDTVSFYLSAENESLNDIVVPIEESTIKTLVNGGVDIQLAQHISCTFLQGPIILSGEKIHQNSEEDTGHFENIYSTNWLTLRLKPPAVNDEIGWRVEFRPLEVQLTDFENAAYVIFIMLLVRSIDKFKLDLAAPISKVDSNWEHAHAKDAVGEKTFFFKENVETGSGDERVYAQMSIDVIINGGVTSSGAEFPGLIPIINRYISTVENADDDTCASISRYLQLISDRAAGRVNTTARWIRNFVKKHPDYKNDSVISERINYDLVKLISEISDGTEVPQHLYSAQQ